MTFAPIWAMLAVGLTTGFMTLLGGALVLRFSSVLDLLFGFSSGTVIGIALFDLLPEALELAGRNHRPLSIMTASAVGFLLYLAIHRSSVSLGQGSSSQRQFAPAALAAHSLLDGLGAGLAFHVSLAAGVIVAIGVLAHDLVDGANTVAVSLMNGADRSLARAWLIIDAAAPSAGILIAGTVVVASFSLAILLGAFAGFFLYIGASELVPRSHARRPRLSTIAATAVGLAFTYLVVLFAASS